ncbi:MAG: CehA/McbA family metallohydrolase [Pirellulales bacterium]|nr:CehA/McbA family metallohydrolase [Pirellulales bacterium]
MRARSRVAAGLLSLYVAVGASLAWGEPLPVVRQVEAQPFTAQAKRIVQALEMLGAPLTTEQQQAFDAALAEADDARRVVAIQAVLDPLCLVGVNINPESRVKVAQGTAAPKLVQQGWTVFLVKVQNEAGVTAELAVKSPNAEPLQKRSSGKPDPEVSIKPTDVGDRWLDVSLFTGQPLNKPLSGLGVEYRLLELYSRDVGKREAKLMFDVGQGTQDLGFRNEVNILFDGEPAVEVVLEIYDDDGQPTTGQFVIRDKRGRIYPAMSRRLAPDLFFHEQVYRHHGESIMLPPGDYEFTCTRGPEYLIEKRNVAVPHSVSHKEIVHLKRWIKLADRGWYSGDHHVHAAGCAHYESPAEGVQPVDMMRHILGEDLNVGCVLSWGPCWYFQKQYFDGKVSQLSTPQNLMRYDVEVSGFPSSHAGHLCLLRLTEDDYPGTTRIEEWPSWDLPVLQWGKRQGGVVGFSHSGWGLKVDGAKLPTYEMPPFDGIGANEYVVDVVHDACDFISAVDTPAVWELNIWYHTLNCGYTCRISGETDFPCIYGERVGLGRAYVKLDAADGPLDYDQWVLGIRDGRSYCCDGLSHLIDFEANGLGVGEPGADGRPSVLALKSGKPLKLKVQAAALLAAEPGEKEREIRERPLDEKPYWHVERARVGDSRKVPVELIVNGKSVERQEIEADGSVSELTFDYTPRYSSWIALRIFPSSHTNPIFVEVDGQPIRASQKSAQWCADAVDVCWKQKSLQIRPSERDTAQAAYEAARVAYRKILAEAQED